MYEYDTPPKPPRRGAGALRIPPLIIAIVALLAILHFVRQQMLDGGTDREIILLFGFWPARFGAQFSEAATLVMSYVKYDMTKYVSVLSYALLHGDFFHLLINCSWFVIFGTPIARRFGAVRAIIFMIGAAAAGALAHFIALPGDMIPMIGASAVVSALMAGCCRFIFRRRAGPGGLIRLDQISGRRLTLWQTAMLPAARGFIAIWFVINGAMALMMPEIAWQAHIGGFLFGLLAFGLLDGGADAPHGQVPGRPGGGRFDTRP